MLEFDEEEIQPVRRKHAQEEDSDEDHIDSLRRITNIIPQE